MDHVGLGNRADFRADPFLQLAAQLVGGLHAVHQRDIGIDALPLQRMRIADHGSLGDLFMGDQGRFDLGRAHPVAADVDHVVHPAGDPVIAVLVPAAAVAGEVVTGILLEIGLHEPLVIAPQRAHLAGPAVGDAQHALGRVAFDQLAAFGLQDRGRDAEEGDRGGTGLRFRRAGQRRDQMAAGLGLPPGIDDGAAALADVFVIPVPGLGVDRLAHAAQQAQAGQVVLLDRLGALGHQRPDRGGRGIELGDLVLGADFPEAAGIGIGRHALEHHGGRAIGQRAIDDIAVARDPAHVRRAPEHVAVMIVEGVLMRHRGIDQIAAGGMDHPLGLAGRAGGIEDEQRILGPHGTGRAIGAGGFHQRLHVHVAPVDPGRLVAGMLDHQAAHPVGTMQQGCVGIRFQVGPAPAAGRGVGGDDHLGAAVVDAVGQGIGRKAREDDGMDRPDPRTGQHRIGRLGDHRQIDHHPVAAHDALGQQHIGEAVHLFR